MGRLANLTSGFGLAIAVRVREKMRQHEDGQHHQHKRQDPVQAKSRPALLTHVATTLFCRIDAVGQVLEDNVESLWSAGQQIADGFAGFHALCVRWPPRMFRGLLAQGIYGMG
jgi:hypothetical protein